MKKAKAEAKAEEEEKAKEAKKEVTSISQSGKPIDEASC
jgi:hypothetical protein